MKLIISDYLCEKLGIYVDIRCIRYFSTKLNVEYNFLNMVNLKRRGKEREDRGGRVAHGVILSILVHDYL